MCLLWSAIKQTKADEIFLLQFVWRSADQVMTRRRNGGLTGDGELVDWCFVLSGLLCNADSSVVYSDVYLHEDSSTGSGDCLK